MSAAKGDGMANAALTSFVRATERLGKLTGPMDTLFIAGRAALSDAAELIDHYGDQAVLAAAQRAEQSRNADNVLRYCHWRQIERMIAVLDSDEVQGTVH